MKRLTFLIAFLISFRCYAATVRISPYAHPQFLDSSGRPLAGGHLCTYAGGTSTPLATYTDSTGSTQNSICLSPGVGGIVLDSGGFARIWIPQGTAYKFALYNSSGVLQWSEDNIMVDAPGGGPDYNANAYPSLQAAVAAVASAGYGRLKLCGTYNVSSTIVLSWPGIIEGCGADGATINYTGTTGAAVQINYPVPPAAKQGPGIRDLTITCATSTQGSTTSTGTFGLIAGGTNGAIGSMTLGVKILGCGWGYAVADNAFTIQNIGLIAIGNTGDYLIPGTSPLTGATIVNSGERIDCNHCSLSQGGPVNQVGAVTISNQNADAYFDSTSFDNAQLLVTAGRATLNGGHMENPGTGPGPYDFVSIVGGNAYVGVFGTEMLQDCYPGLPGPPCTAPNELFSINQGILALYGPHIGLAQNMSRLVTSFNSASRVVIFGYTVLPFAGYIAAAVSGATATLSGQGDLLADRLRFSDNGTCTMAAGTCPAQNLSQTWASAPRCFANWNGTGTLTGFLKVPSTTTTVTPASSVGSDTATVNWTCFGGPGLSF